MAKQPEETSLIQTYFAPLAAPGGLGLRDDAACLTPTPGMDLVVTTDTIVEGVHFLSTDTPYQVAIKAITVNLSDLVAKGANPIGYQVALSLPEKPDADWLAGFSKGLGEQINGQLLGGDLTVSRGGPLTISVTAIGEVPHGRMVRREGGRTGDDIYVCGMIGTSAVGLKCAIRSDWVKRVGLSKDALDHLLNAYAAPMVKNHERVAELVSAHASASLDISDGLAIDLERLCAASSVGAVVQTNTIPLHAIVADLIASGHFLMEEAITGGDDYVALFCARPQTRETIALAGADLCHRIGRLVEPDKGVTFLNEDGSPLSLEAGTGYDHFS